MSDPTDVADKLRAIVSLARNLWLKTVIEGVETEQQLEALLRRTHG